MMCIRGTHDVHHARRSQSGPNLIAQAVPEDTKQYISGYIANSKMLEAAEATA